MLVNKGFPLLNSPYKSESIDGMGMVYDPRIGPGDCERSLLKQLAPRSEDNHAMPV